MHSLYVEKGFKSWQELLLYLATMSQADDIDMDQDAVTVCTCHCAKGREWPVVLLVGLDAGVFPSKLAVRDGTEAEERRLAFVSYTRAEDRLYLISNREKSKFFEETGEVQKLELDGDQLPY